MAGATVAATIRIPRYSSAFRDAAGVGADARLLHTALDVLWRERIAAKLGEADVVNLRQHTKIAESLDGLYAILTFAVATRSAAAGPSLARALSDDTITFHVVADDMPFGGDAVIISDVREYLARTLVGDVLAALKDPEQSPALMRARKRLGIEGKDTAVPHQEKPQPEDELSAEELAGLAPDDERVPDNAVAASTAVSEAMHERGVIVDTFRATDEDVAQGRTVVGMPHHGGRSDPAQAEAEQAAAPADVVSAPPVPNEGDQRPATTEARTEDPGDQNRTSRAARHDAAADEAGPSRKAGTKPDGKSSKT